jgi:hypothetical protein
MINYFITIKNFQKEGGSLAPPQNIFTSFSANKSPFVAIYVAKL